MKPRTRLLIAASLLLANCSDVSFVGEVTIINQTEYPAHVEVTDQNRDGWLGLTVVDEVPEVFEQRLSARGVVRPR